MLFEAEIEGFATLAADCLSRADLLRAQWRPVLSPQDATSIAAAITREEKKALRFQIEAERLRIIARRQERPPAEGL